MKSTLVKRDDSGQRSPGYISDALRSPWATFAMGGIGLNNLPVTNVFWTNCFYIGTTWPTQADTLNAKHWKLHIWPKLQFYSKGHTEKPKLNLLKNHIRCKLHRIVQCSNVAIILLSFGYQKVPVHDFMCVCVWGGSPIDLPHSQPIAWESITSSWTFLWLARRSSYLWIIVVWSRQYFWGKGFFDIVWWCFSFTSFLDVDKWFKRFCPYIAIFIL